MEFAVAILGALGSAVLPVVVSAFKAKFEEPLPCKQDVVDLGNDLGLIIAKIKDHDEAWYGKKSSNEREELVKTLRRLAYEIEDCTEKFLRQVMSDDGLEKNASVKFGDDIRRLRDSVKKWIQRLTDGTKPDGATSSAAGAPDLSADTTICVPPVGMEEHLEELKKLVAEADRESERKLKVISIVGFGGLGKTLLASQVYNYLAENSEFDLQVWIRADDKNVQQLLEEILEKLDNASIIRKAHSIGKKMAHDSPISDVVRTTNARTFAIWLQRLFSPTVVVHTVHAASLSISTNADPQDMGKDSQEIQKRDKGKAKGKEKGTSFDITISEVNRLVKRLKSCLLDKRYLIVIIDMRKKEQWCGIRSAFTRTSEIDSRIIVTTTKHPVARGCSDGGGYVYKMGTLTGDDPRKLFFRGSDRNFPEPSAIPKSCDGLPLALISISENCEGEFDKLEEKSEEAFSKICGPQAADTSLNASGNTPSERMRRILLSSYQDLPNSFVKVSLIYLCMFPPDDDNVRRNSVIRRLLAEGLAQTGDGKAVNNLETLIDHCVTQSTEVSNNGKTKRCKVPGMVLEYIARISQSQGFLTVCDESQTAEPPTDARRLFLHPNSQWKLPEESEPKVRTLAVFSKRDQATTLSNKEAIAKCELLRVLDLEGCGGLDDSDLRNFCNLLLLRYLSLSGSITNVPTEIKKLQVLETLDLRKTKIGMVPVEVIKLPHLKNLLGKFQLAKDGVFSKNVVDFMTNKNTVKKNLVAFLTSQDSKLEMLSGFVTGRSQGFPQLLIHMTKLRKVKIWLDSTADKKNLEYLSGGIVKFLRLTRHDNGRSLSIYIKDCPNILCEDIFLDSLLVKQGGHHPSLYCFKLYGRLKGFPDFLTHLNKITELCLSGTGLKTDQLLSGLNRLPKSSLKYLKLIEQKLGPLKLSKENFTSLVRICLVADKTEDITISDGAMPSNAALYINGAEQKYVALSSLVSLHVLCKSLDGLSGIDIRRFPLLKEVGLHPGLDTINKGLWETAANKHPNWPNLVLIDPPKPKGP